VRKGGDLRSEYRAALIRCGENSYANGGKRERTLTPVTIRVAELTGNTQTLGKEKSLKKGKIRNQESDWAREGMDFHSVGCGWEGQIALAKKSPEVKVPCLKKAKKTDTERTIWGRQRTQLNNKVVRKNEGRDSQGGRIRKQGGSERGKRELAQQRF